MKIKAICELIEDLAPLPYAEDFDNVGLLVGDAGKEATGVLVTLDTLEHVVDEAIEKKCNLIVSFHPIIFKGLKKLTGANYVERVVMKALQNDIAIYAIHTALDNVPQGVNRGICDQLGIGDPRILIPKKQSLLQLTTYVPTEHADALREALFASGAGSIGNYRNCSFSLQGKGSFEAQEGANPTLGEIGKTHYEEEEMVRVVLDKKDRKTVLNALFATHPYEEVAYELTRLENERQDVGMGMIGTLADEMTETEFLNLLKEKMHTPVVRHSELRQKPVKKVAVLGGSGAFAIPAAKQAGADVLVTADLKYHDFFSAEGNILLADIGHFESEQFTKSLLVDYLKKKIPNFAISLSESITNPIKYY